MQSDISRGALPTLLEGAARLKIQLDRHQIEQFVRFCDLVLETNALFNLTALRGIQSVTRGLVLDSLALSTVLPPLRPEARVVDVGSGAGAPGIPLKILNPEWTVTLVESIGKKAQFLREAVVHLALPRTRVAHARAEDLGWDTDLRDSCDLCVARAVAPLPSLVELCAPFVRPGGWMAFPKGGDARREAKDADAAARALGARLVGIQSASVTVEPSDDRVVVLYQKVGATPGGFPRRTGLARSRPIGISSPDARG